MDTNTSLFLVTHCHKETVEWCLNLEVSTFFKQGQSSHFQNHINKILCLPIPVLHQNSLELFKILQLQKDFRKIKVFIFR